MISFLIYIVHIYIYIYVYVYKSFTTVDKGLKKNSKKRHGEIGEHKLNEMGAMNMK